MTHPTDVWESAYEKAIVHAIDARDDELTARVEATSRIEAARIVGHIEAMNRLSIAVICSNAAKTDGMEWPATESWLSDPRPPEGEVELETEHLFSNQWNAACGPRVFDWYEGIVENRKIKKGHYLDITDEMREIRRTTYACGYCGALYRDHADSDIEFCDRCLGSEYLKQDEIHLLRLKPVAEHMPKREPLTDNEKARLVPLYIERQTTATDSRGRTRIQRQRQEIEEKRDKAIQGATEEAAGMLWLLDHNFPIDNVIYYQHTQKFAFGWRSPVSNDVAQRILEFISEFPYAYEIRGVERTWEGQ